MTTSQTRRNESMDGFTRRHFLRGAGAVGVGAMLAPQAALAEEEKTAEAPSKPKTNIDDAMAVPRAKHALPGPFPGRVVQVHDPKSIKDDKFVQPVISEMFAKGLQKLTGKDAGTSFKMLFTPQDIVGIKVNPVGGKLMSTSVEVVHAIVEWLAASGLPKSNIVIWDRFDFQLPEAGFTAERFPGVSIEGLQSNPGGFEADLEATKDKWQDKDGNHISAGNFDPDVFYWADIEPEDTLGYHFAHVFKGKRSYFGKLVTQRLTKIINVPVFKNAGPNITIALKNLGYAAICNTARLHAPLTFDVCAEVTAFPCIRDKVVLNVTDAIRGQYEGGPLANTQFMYDLNSLLLSTDPVASDVICYDMLMQKRKAAGLRVVDHPKHTEYFRYAERLKLGMADPDKIKVFKI